MARASGYETGDLPDAAVHVLVALNEPRHGYAVMTFLEEQQAHIAMGPATLYTTLKKLLGAHLIEELDGEGTRRPYRRTAEGTRVLVDNIERRRALVALADRSLGAAKEES